MADPTVVYAYTGQNPVSRIDRSGLLDDKGKGGDGGDGGSNGVWCPLIVALHVNLDKTADLTKETSSVQAASIKRC